jgi:hypothetical protein
VNPAAETVTCFENLSLPSQGCNVALSLYGHFSDHGHPEYVWFTLGLHSLIGIFIFMAFTRIAGEFREQEK